MEVLDFAGPFEVLSRTRLVPGTESRRSDDGAPFHVFTVARSTDLVTATGGLVVQPRHSFEDAPSIDLLVVPGGFGTRPLLQEAETIDWIRRTAGRGPQDRVRPARVHSSSPERAYWTTAGPPRTGGRSASWLPSARTSRSTGNRGSWRTGS